MQIREISIIHFFSFFYRGKWNRGMVFAKKKHIPLFTVFTVPDSVSKWALLFCLYNSRPFSKHFYCLWATDNKIMCDSNLFAYPLTTVFYITTQYMLIGQSKYEFWRENRTFLHDKYVLWFSVILHNTHMYLCACGLVKGMYIHTTFHSLSCWLLINENFSKQIPR